VICWSCEKAAGEGEFCAACGAVMPPDAGADHFAVLGVVPAFAVDLGELERRYKDAARRLHPDRFVRADPRARRASLARSVQLNDAWKTLRDPVKRAEYLLAKAGIEVGGEEGTMRTTGGAASGKEKVPVPQALLMDVMELREGLMDARAEDDDARVRALTADVRERRRVAMDAVAAAFAAAPADVDRAASELVAVRYYDRFLAEVAAGESAPVHLTLGSNHAG
jgi:molecular chaperone HscB